MLLGNSKISTRCGVTLVITRGEDMWKGGHDDIAAVPPWNTGPALRTTDSHTLEMEQLMAQNMVSEGGLQRVVKGKKVSMRDERA